MPAENIKEKAVLMAKQVLLRNRKVCFYNGKKYTYTCPAKGWYDQQWLWDSCFHTLSLAKFDIEAAKSELEILLSQTDESGFLPNVIMWDTRNKVNNYFFSLFLFKNNRSNITQPPVVAVALEEIFEKTNDLEYLNRLLPSVIKYFDYLKEKRDPENSGLISIIHPWETGIDSTPSFDEALSIKNNNPSNIQVYQSFYKLLIQYTLDKWDIDQIIKKRKFNIKHVMYNCIYIQGLYSLSRLCKKANNDSKSLEYLKLAQISQKALIDKCWNEEDGIFYDLCNDKQIKVATISSIFPIILENIPKEKLDILVEKYIHNENKFWTKYPLSTVPADSKKFNPNDNKVVLWRGPVWINANWFVIKGLEKNGYTQIAEELRNKTIELIAKNETLYEFYNPLNGKGEGQKNFSWTSLVLDLVEG